MTFDELELTHEVARAINAFHYTEPTEIQKLAIPEMRKGRDIIAKAPTGTGKTFAFGIPIIEALNPAEKNIKALILAPTRELTIQISEQLRLLAKFKDGIRVASIYGGQSINKQIESLRRHPQIVVATPGRLIDLKHRGELTLEYVTIAVLDEADEMLDMGFMKDVRSILDSLSAMEQMVMFSATISREVMDIGWLYQRDAVELEVLPQEESLPPIDQFCLFSYGGRKLADFMAIMDAKSYQKVLVFCNTKRMTDRLYTQLVAKGYCADCLHGDIPQSTRNRIMQDFRNDKIDVLVATDVAARGIDVANVEAVFSYDVPQENAYYTHRIGRTGRAKKKGASYIFYSLPERDHLLEIFRLTKAEVTPIRINARNEIEVLDRME